MRNSAEELAAVFVADQKGNPLCSEELRALLFYISNERAEREITIEGIQHDEAFLLLVLLELELNSLSHEVES